MNNEWYSDAIEKLNPLRWHLHELVDMCEQHNRVAEVYNKWENRNVDMPFLSKEKIEAAKKPTKK
jgi:hypothetical protein